MATGWWYRAVHGSARGFCAALLLGSLTTRTGQAQSDGFPTERTIGRFVPGSREIFALSLSSATPGGLPKGISVRDPYRDNPGEFRDAAPDLISVVTKDGVPMLKATKLVELKIQLPEALPDAFTLEFDLIPKTGGGEDLSFEGTPHISRSPTSMHVVWSTQSVIAVGGCEQCYAQIPNALQDVVAAQPTTIQASFQGTTFQLFTNGQPMFKRPLDKRSFVHGRMLRVSLGGQDNNQNAVYLSKLRIAASTSSADLGTFSSGVNGALTEATGTRPIGTVLAPTATSVATPTNPGVTSGPLPAGSVTSPSAGTATQPSALSPTTNSLPIVSTTTTTTTQQQASTINGLAAPGSRQTSPTPTPTTKTITSTTSATTPGPATLTAVDLRTTNGFGVRLKWDALPGYTSYVVTRKVANTTDVGRYISVVLVPSTDASSVTAIDPYPDVNLNATYMYWVSGFTSTRGETQPSPVAEVVVSSAPPPAPWMAKVTAVTAPQMRTMPGVLAASSPMLGSAVTWEWAGVINVNLYHVSYEIVGDVAGVGPVFMRSLVTTFGAATPPPMTVNVPQGKTVKLCVHLYASADLTVPLPSGATCTEAVVP